MMAFLNEGLEIRFADERPGHEQSRSFEYTGGIVDFVRHLNESKEPLFRKVGYFEQSEERPRGRGRAAVEHRLLREHPLLRQRHRDHRGRHARGGLPEGAHQRRQPLRQGPEPAEGEGREPRRRGHPRGPDGDPLGAAARPQFEGQTKAKLGNVSMRSLVERTTNEKLAEWLEENPQRSRPDRAEGAARRTGARGGPPGPRPHPAQVRPRRRRPAGQARRLLVARPARVGAVHRRGQLGRRLGARTPATRGPRRSCRSAARS